MALWHEAHIGVDAKWPDPQFGYTTAANEHDLNQLGNLLHGEEPQFVSGDAGYQGAPQREELWPGGCGLWLIAERPGTR